VLDYDIDNCNETMYYIFNMKYFNGDLILPHISIRKNTTKL